MLIKTMSLPRRTFLRGMGAAAALPFLGGVTPGVAAAQRAGQARPAGDAKAPLVANLVCGGAARDHDLDFARRRLLDALYDANGIFTDVAHDFNNSAAIEAGDLLVSYTSLISTGPAESQAIRRFLEKGGRWFALHASNYIRDNQSLPDSLGSHFLVHPPYGPFTVSVTRPNDPLLAGIQSFEVEDELYVMDHSDDIEVLLHARYGGEISGRKVEVADQPLMYRRRIGQGGVLFLALGHTSRPSNPPQPGAAPQPVRHGSWDQPVFQELVRRGIDWAARRRDL